MAFEELDADTAAFFNNAAGTPPTEAAAVNTPPAEAVEAPAEAVVQPAETVSIEPAPAAQPVAAPQPDTRYFDQLLAERDAREAALKKQLDEVQAKIAERDAPKPPDPQTDPLGALLFKLDQQQAELASLKQQLTTGQQQQQADQGMQQFMTTVNSQVQDFMKTHADYPQAFKYLVDLRTEEYAIRGLTKQQAEESLAQEQMQITQAALKSNRNVGEVVYNMATRYGYRPSAATVATNAPAAPASKIDELKKGLETQAPVQRAETVPQANITVSAVKDMSERELNALVLDDDKWNKLMGHGGKGIF